MGFSEKAIEHRLVTGRLHRVARGVYAVGRPQPTREGEWIAAILACGDGAVLSHGSAAALYGIGWERRDPADPRPERERRRLIEVAVRRRVWPRRDGVLVRARPALLDADLTVHRGIPVTTPARTIVDQAAAVERHTPAPPACPDRSASRRSTATTSTSTGPSWALSSSATASATTAPR